MCASVAWNILSSKGGRRRSAKSKATGVDMAARPRVLHLFEPMHACSRNSSTTQLDTTNHAPRFPQPLTCFPPLPRSLTLPSPLPRFPRFPHPLPHIPSDPRPSHTSRCWKSPQKRHAHQPTSSMDLDLIKWPSHTSTLGFNCAVQHTLNELHNLFHRAPLLEAATRPAKAKKALFIVCV